MNNTVENFAHGAPKHGHRKPEKIYRNTYVFLLELTNTNVGFVVHIDFFIQNKVCFYEPKTWENFGFFGLNF